MTILVDNINKIVYVLPHKCGQYTISTFLMRIYNNSNNYDADYYTHELEKMGMTKFKKEYIKYHKILVLRNPYERFISGFLQDCTKKCNLEYKNINLTFYEYCLYLKKIYNKKCVNYYIKDNKNILFSNNFNITYDKLYENKLKHHIKPMYNEIDNLLKLFNYKFDKVIIVDELTETLNNIKVKFNIKIDFEIGNKKKYNESDNIDIINTKVCDIANGAPYPQIQKFYNKEIYDIVKQLYKDDFNMFKQFKIEDKLIFNY